MARELPEVPQEHPKRVCPAQVTEQTLLPRRRNLADLAISKVREFKELEREDPEAKKIVADLWLGNGRPREVTSKIVCLAQKSHATRHLAQAYEVSKRHAGRVLDLPWSTKRPAAARCCSQSNGPFALPGLEESSCTKCSA